MKTSQTFEIESTIVPSPVNYSVLVPDGEPSGILLFLHGGFGDEKSIRFIEPIIRDLWNSKKFPNLIVTIPSCTRSLYMNYRDGSEMWESFILEEFLPFLQEKYQLYSEKNKKIYISGVSAGGLGALRIGLKFCEKFAAIISFEPAIEPVFEWNNIEIIDNFYRNNKMFERIFGREFG